MQLKRSRIGAVLLALGVVVIPLLITAGCGKKEEPPPAGYYQGPMAKKQSPMTGGAAQGTKDAK